MQRPELPPSYAVEEVDHDRPFQLRLGSELVEERIDTGPLDPRAVYGPGSYFDTREEASAAAWAHWRKNADPAWVAFVDRAQEVTYDPAKVSVTIGDGLTPQREPFEGYLDIEDDQREVAQGLVDRYAEVFERAGIQAPTVDTVITAAHLQQLAEVAAAQSGLKTSKLVSGLFDGKSKQSEATSLMLAALVMRLYGAPYGSLNEALLDFVNVIVPALVMATPVKPKLKHGSQAKGKRPQ